MSKLRKSLAILLSILMLTASLVPTVFAAPIDDFVDNSIDGSMMSLNQIISQDEYTVIGGVLERNIVVNTEKGDHQNNCFVFEIPAYDPNVSIIAGYNDGDADGWGKVPVRTHAEAAERVLGVNVVGAINADFHNQTTGEPAGILVMNGVVGHAQNGRPFFAILNDGTPVIRMGGAPIDDVKEAVAGSTILVSNGENRAPSSNLAPRTAIGIKPDNTVVMFVVDGRQDPHSCGMAYPEVAEMMIALGCEIALELDGGGSSTFLAQQEGIDKLACRNSPSYGYERKVSTSLLICTNLEATGDFSHVKFSENVYKVAPYSTVSLAVRGVDTNGYSVAIPSGGKMVLRETNLGSLDGKTFISNGSEGFAIVDYVVNGEVLASVSIEVTEAENNLVESMFAQILDFFYSIINTFKLLIEKFNEKILGRL